MTADPTRILDEIQARADAATEGPWEADCGTISQHWSRPEPWQTVVSTDVACMAYCYGGSAAGVEREADAAFIAAARTDLPRLVAALRAVLEVHRGAQYLGEPGDAGCPHDDDYDGDRHFVTADGDWLCVDAAAGDFYCLGCPLDEWGDPIAYPCPTVTAITEALEER